MVTAFDFDLPFAPCREPFRDSYFNSYFKMALRTRYVSL